MRCARSQTIYVTLPALLAALIGLALAARRWFWRDPALIVTVVVFACFFFYKVRIVPDHFWMARRFLPVILPGVLLLASAAALGGIRRPSGNAAGIVRTLVRVLFVAVLAFQYARASRPVLNHVEYAGLIPRLERLAGTIGDDDLVIVEGRDAQTDIHVLGTSPGVHLRPQCPRAALTATRQGGRCAVPRVGPDAVSTSAVHGRRRHRPPLTSLWRPRTGERPFQVPEYDAPLNAYPQARATEGIRVRPLRIHSRSRWTGLWFDLDVGVADDLHVLRFHAKEETEGRTFRWTRATSYVSVTIIRPSAAR